MNNRRSWLILALLLCAVIGVTAATPSTVAYIADRGNTVRNTFRVEYLPPQDVTVPVLVRKTVLSVGDESISPAGFCFHLENLDTGDITTMTTLASGETAVHLTFTADDIGKTYHYRLSEYNNGRNNVIYDETVYNICITLQLNGQHEMFAAITINGEAAADIVAEFVNTYHKMDIPDTGDYTHPLLWLVLLLFSSTGLALCRRDCIFRRPLWNRRKYGF